MVIQSVDVCEYPSHFSRGQDHNGPDIEASKGKSLYEANANANDEKGDEQRQPNTFSCPIFVACRKMKMERTTAQSRGEGDKPWEGGG